MIRSLRERSRGDLLSFGDGVLAMLHDPGSDEALAAATLVAETLHLHHAWLESEFKKR